MGKEKTILLISPKENESLRKIDAYPSGAFLLIGTMLKNMGHRVKVVQLAADSVEIQELKNIIHSFSPDIVGITVNTFQTKSAKEVSKTVKEVNPAITVVAGGPHPSAVKVAFLSDFPNVDIVVVGEGEHTFMEIVEGKALSEIKGICYDGKENPPRPQAANLDYIPLPDLSLVNLKKFSGADPVGAYPSMFIMASRGCPFHCTFCNKSIWGTNVRFRKPELIIKEIEWLHDKYGIREIFFQDDTFNLNRKWAEAIFKLIIEKGLNKRLVFKTPFRANEPLVDEALLKLAKSAGFWLIFYGVESGNQQMLDKMGKGLTLDELRRAFRLTHKAGLKTIGSFILGMPGETEDTARDTMNFWRELKPYVTGCGAAMPFPNTTFDKIVTEKGHKLISNYDEYAISKVIVRTDTLDYNQLAALCAEFRKLIIKQFFIDLLKLRYLRMIFFVFKSPWYIYHIYYRIASYLGFK